VVSYCTIPPFSHHCISHHTISSSQYTLHPHIYADTKDELFQQSILKIDNDEFYTVHFTEKKPLGVVFERSGEWAIIKSSTNQAESGLLVGSVLSTIDKHSVILEGYQDTIDRLKGWSPPLVLGFRKAPRKIGFLLKESKSRSNPQKMVWKKRYFVLGEGKILYKDSDEVGAKIKGECPLMGSVVSLVNEDEAGKRNCFRLMSGMMYLTLQSGSEYEMMDWASMLYHAISIANGGAYILQYEIDRLTAHAEDSKAAELALKGVRIPSVRIKSSSKSPPPTIRRSLSESPPPGSSTTYVTHTTTTSTSSPTESYKKGSSWKNLVKQVMTVEQAENERLLELAMKNATCDDLGELVKMICHTKVHGVNVDRAEKRLQELKNQKKRRSEGPKTYRMDGEGEDDVQAQLSSIQERNERRRVADASAQLVRVVQSVGYDNESIHELERAIALAVSAGVSRENVEKAKQLLARLHEGNRLLEEALRQLQTAMRKRSLPMLVDAVSTASEIGFHHEQLQVDLASARRLIIEIKGEALDSSLQQAAIDATVDNHDNLATLVERAKVKDANVDPMKLHKAQEVLTDLRRKKAEKEDINLLIRRAINERNLHLLQTALQSATHSKFTGPDVRPIICCFFIILEEIYIYPSINC
jgi:PH domain